MRLPAGHRPQLDGLRAIAVAMVAIYHWTNIEIWGVEPPFGDIGVGLFFVLSGYLITGILLGVRDRVAVVGGSLWYAARSFAVRRIVRLVPAMYLYLFAVWLLGFNGDDGWWWYLLYAGNFRIVDIGIWPGGFSHLWSLSVEEQFYLVAPAFMLLFSRAWMKMTLIMILIAPSWLALAGVDLPLILPPVAFVGLLVGCVLAVDGSDSDAPPLIATVMRNWPIVTALAIALFVVRINGALVVRLAPFNLLVAYVAMAALVWGAAVGYDGQFGRLLEHRWLQFVGRISYGVYLRHFLAVDLRALTFDVVPEQVELAEVPILTAITVTLASASYYLVEQHVNALKNRFPYVRVSNRVETPDRLSV